MASVLGKMQKPSGSRMIKTSVKLFERKVDSFSSSQGKRTGNVINTKSRLIK